MGVHVHDTKKTEQAARFLKPGLSKAAEFFRMLIKVYKISEHGLSSGYDGA